MLKRGTGLYDRLTPDCCWSLLPLLKVPGVLRLTLGPLWAIGVEGTDKVACTAVSVLSASRVLRIGVLGFSCFCCTASSCRKSKEKHLGYIFQYRSTCMKNALVRLYG